MVKRHQRPVPGRPNLQVGVIEKEGPIHVSNVAIVDPKDHKPTRVRHRPATSRASACASPGAPERSSTDGARLKDRYNDEIRAALVGKFGYSTPMQAPEAGQGDAQHGRRRGQAGLEDARGRPGAARRHRGPEAEHPARPQVRRAFKLREGMPVGLTVTLRDERAYEFLDRLVVGRDPAPARLPRPEPEVLRRPWQLQHGHQGAGHLPGDRLRHRRSGPRPGHRDHHHRQTDAEAFTLLDALGMPFARDGRPRQYESSTGEPVAA